MLFQSWAILFIVGMFIVFLIMIYALLNAIIKGTEAGSFYNSKNKGQYKTNTRTNSEFSANQAPIVHNESLQNKTFTAQSNTNNFFVSPNEPQKTGTTFMNTTDGNVMKNQAGNTAFYTGGGIGNTAGNTTFFNDGTTKTTVGNTDFYSNGLVGNKVGNTTYFSDGTTKVDVGGTSFLSGQSNQNDWKKF
ncbi:MAG: hypothetical protein LBM27_06045 [Lactobacillaceae bacterium]|jgi:hypothetical protein|nr:hypothetical protein [Lactobacillaceae bacterium]